MEQARRTFTVVTHGAEHDVELTAPESTTLREVAIRLLAAGLEPLVPPSVEERAVASRRLWPDDLRPSDGPYLWSDGPLRPALTLAESPLRDGLRVGFGAEPPTGRDEFSPRPTDFEVRIVAGPGAGRIRRYSRRELLVAPLSLPNDPTGVIGPDLTLVQDEVWTSPTGQSLPGAGDRRIYRTAARWRPEDLLMIGDNCLRLLAGPFPEPRELPRGGGGTLLVDRRPRARPSLVLAVGDTPDDPRKRWWHSGRTRDRRQAEHLLALRLQRSAAATAEWNRLAPDPAEVRSIALLRGEQLWERRNSADLLVLRCGVGTDTPVPGAGLRPHERDFLPPGEQLLPATVSLTEHGVIGVAGPGDRPRRLAAWFAAQSAVLHSPDDVVLRVFTDAAAAPAWRWLRWLPRSSSPLDSADAPRVHADATAVAQQTGALLALLSERRRADAALGATKEWEALRQDVERREKALRFARNQRAAASRTELGESARYPHPDPPGRLTSVSDPAVLARTALTAARAHVVALALNRHLLALEAIVEMVDAHRRRLRGPDVILVLDGARRLRAQPGIARLLSEGPEFGVYVVCLDAQARQLPPECRYRVEVSDSGPSHVIRGDERTAILPDLPDPGWFEPVARALAPLRDAAPVQRERDFRATALPELLGLETPDEADAITARWTAVPRSTATTVGLADGSAFELDLRGHGPHALVAGASGSGRTAFLRAWVTSLAVANRPDEMMFVLIDHKGGGGTAFQQVAELPHVAHRITDLDSRQAERILIRLQAALRDREAHLVSSAAADIEHYHELRDRHPELPPMPRLVCVIDEFAGLARDLPVFLSGLLAVAQRGRSLGVHLVLGTQRPGDALTPDLRSATNLRIALRLTDAAESEAVVDATAAAGISRATPGRAFARAGADDLVEFQTAVLNGRRSGPAAPPVVRIREPDGAGEPPGTPAGEHRPAAFPTDLDLLVLAVHEAARRLDVPQVPGPLPEPLPSVVTLSELPSAELPWDELPPAEPPHGSPPPVHPQHGGPPPIDPQRQDLRRRGLPRRGVPPDGPPPDALPAAGPPPDALPARDLPPVAYGIAELPDEVGRNAALFDLAATGSLGVAGAPRSGRSQFLRTFAAAVAGRYSTADVHLFGIDCGDGALQALTALPHCGTVVTRSRPDHLARLVGRLTAALYSRGQILAEGGFHDIAAQRQAVPAASRLPYLVLLLDRWEEFERLDQNRRLVSELHLLLKEGARVGVRLILAGGPELLRGRTGALIADQLVLNQRTSADYTLFGVDPPAERLDPGRAFVAHSAVELQIALLDGAPTTRGQTDALDRLAARLRLRDADVPGPQRPSAIDDAPRAADQFHVGAGRGRPVGREDVLAWLRDRHATGASAALLGPRRAGKTWVLEELSRRLTADGNREVRQLVVPQPSEAVDSPDALAALLDREVRAAASPAEALLDKAGAGAGTSRPVFLLDEVGRLAGYDPAAVSWLRDLGQAGAWLVYTGTEKDWRSVVRWALTAPGSSFGNDVNARTLGPLDRDAALDFLSGTAANLGVSLDRDTTAARIVRTVGSWPFYLQVAGDAVVRAVQGNDLTPLSGYGALRALIHRRLLDEWTHHFQSRWAEIGPAGRAALLTAPGAMPKDATPAQRQELREVGLLRPGEQWLDDPPLLDWITRNEISLRDGELPA